MGVEKTVSISWRMSGTSDGTGTKAQTCTYMSHTNNLPHTSEARCCEKPAFCRCIEHGGTCRNCGKKREEVTHSLPQEKGTHTCPQDSEGLCDDCPCHIETSSWEKPEDFKKFRDFAIDCGVPGAAFWDDAVHCSCFFDGKDGDEDSPGVVRGMYQMWKAQEETLSQARREYMTSLAERVEALDDDKPGEFGGGYAFAKQEVLALIEKDLEK